MKTQLQSFGFLPQHVDFVVRDVSVRSLPGLEKIVEAVRKSPTVHKGWLYAPNPRRTDIVTGETAVVPVPGRIFGLPKTHQIETASAHPDGLGRFLAWCIGFFVGVRLTETEMGFLDATPIEMGALCDFRCSMRELPRVLEAATDFYFAHRVSRISETLLGAIHALWLSQSPHLLSFERFHYAYTALDAIWRVAARIKAVKAGVAHACRIAETARLIGMVSPAWASVVPERNSANHEGLFFGEPLGFAIYQESTSGNNTIGEMRAFACRAIVGLLGVPAPDYISSPIDCHQTYGLL